MQISFSPFDQLVPVDSFIYLMGKEDFDVEVGVRVQSSPTLLPPAFHLCTAFQGRHTPYFVPGNLGAERVL